MNDYINNLEDFYPSDVSSTGKNLTETTIPIVEDIPDVTALSSEVEKHVEDNPPIYIAPKSMVVKRYWLKK